MTTDLLQGVLPEEARVLALDLVRGKPELGWRGDPSLSLRFGVLTAAKAGCRIKPNSSTMQCFQKGEITDVFLQVFRHTEEGKDELIVSKPVTKAHEVIPSLIEQDPRTPGFTNVMDRVERAYKAKDKANDDEIENVQGEMLDHALFVGKNVLGVKDFHGQVGATDSKQVATADASG